jgi:prepilin peptidase CpaA
MDNNPFLLIREMASVLGAVLLMGAAAHDVAVRSIPNWMSCLLALGILLRFLDASLMAGLSLGLFVFAVAVFCWKQGWLGGGDVKLITAAAIFVPPANVGDLLLAITLCGGVVALTYLFGRLLSRGHRHSAFTRPRGRIARILRVERWRLSRGGPLPYASAIAAGTILVVFAE